MRIKTYTAPTVSDAMALVRKELGLDAVIVSTVETEDEVRLTAALEDEEGMIDSISASSHPLPGLELVCERLEQHNAPTDLSEKIIETCSQSTEGDVAVRLIHSLKSIFRFSTLPEFESEPLPTLLIGPPGVGKTVTITRLACSTRGNRHPVHVITTDAQKAGAISQITSFAKALSLSVSVAKSPDEMGRVIEEAPSGAPILIDTPGINPFNKDELDRLAQIVLSVRVAPVLALPAGGDAIEQQEMMEAFGTLGATRLILTKMDLAKRLGGLLSGIHKTRIQMMAYGNSPLVKHPLNPLSPKELALLLLDDISTQRQSYAA